MFAATILVAGCNARNSRVIPRCFQCFSEPNDVVPPAEVGSIAELSFKREVGDQAGRLRDVTAAWIICGNAWVVDSAEGQSRGRRRSPSARPKNFSLRRRTVRTKCGIGSVRSAHNAVNNVCKLAPRLGQGVEIVLA